MHNKTSSYKKRSKKKQNYLLKFLFRLCKKLLALAIFAIVIMIVYPPQINHMCDTIYHKIMQKFYVSNDKISILGQERLKSENLLKTIKTQSNTNIFTMDISVIRFQLESIPWIKEAIVERVFPDKISIQIIEETPQAIYKNIHSYYYINREGKIIQKINDENFDGLLIVSGDEANLRYEALVNELRNFHKIYQQLESLSLIDKRRWDIKLKNNFLIKLPETNISQGLQIIEDNFDISLNMPKICLIDLRIIPDKLYLK